MKKNIFVKIIVLFVFVLFFIGANYVLAEDATNIPIDEQVVPDPISTEEIPTEDSSDDTQAVVPENVSIRMKINTSSVSLFNRKIDVTPCDSDNDQSTPDVVTAYCAVLQTGIPSVWDWSWAPGAFLTSFKNISGFTSKDKDGNDVYHYWSWYSNGEEGMTGLNQYTLEPDDEISLLFIDPVEEPVRKGSYSSSGSMVAEISDLKIFSTPLALSYLSANQKDDGSFINELYTDWAIVGIAKSGEESQSMKEKISDYYKKENTGLMSTVTDYERRAMALMSLGVDPYLGTDTNYIDKIISSYDGVQIGDKDLYNDDIFGLVVLSHAGYTKDDEIIKNIIAYILSKQSEDGSWGGVDMTAAAIEAVYDFKDLEEVTSAVSKGEIYLKDKQKDNGSFDDNPSSTSWAIQALSLNDSYSAQVDAGIKYLAEAQQGDGGVGVGESASRIWNTAYAIPAVMKLSWGDILQNFSKQEIKKEEIKTPEEKIYFSQDEASKTVKAQIVKSVENNPSPAPAGNLLEAKAITPLEKNNLVFSSVFRFFKLVGVPFFSFWIGVGF